MALVDLTQLGQEELWAVMYERQQRNKQIAAQNAQIEAFNLARPVNTEARPLQALMTDQTMADEIARRGIAGSVGTLRQAKTQINAAAYIAKPLDVQAQIDALLEVPPLIQG